MALNRTPYLVQLSSLVMLWGLVACQLDDPMAAPRPAPLSQDERIQVYTNHEPSSSYTEPYRQQTRDGDNLEQIIIDAIASAHSSVDVAVQELRLPGIAQALVDRHKAGVRVRVILENSYARPFSQFTAEDIAKLTDRERDHHKEAIALIDINHDGQLSPDEINQRDALVMLDNARIPRIDDTAGGRAGSSLMHDKFVIVDGHSAIVTSANFTTSDIHGDFKTPKSQGNANNLLKIESPELAVVFTQEFERMWGDGPGGKPDSLFGVRKPLRPARQVMVGATAVDIQFSPNAPTVPWAETSNGLIGKTLATAKQSVEMALFVFSDQPLVTSLNGVHQRGVEIKALIDPSFAYRPYSKGLTMLGIDLAEKCQFDPNNAPWQPAISTVGVPRLPPGDLLHHKFGIVDQETVVTGSHNWTDAANTGNDETVLVIHNRIVAAHYQREFERLYTSAILGVPPTIQKKAAAQAQRCSENRGQSNPQLTVPAHVPQVKATGTATPAHTAHRQRVNTQRSPIAGADNHAPKATSSSQRVNLNTASQLELEELPGVGPSLAKRIIAAREQKRFSSLADFDQVPGVGPKLLAKLKDRITW